jgi:hypothetical protein
MWCISLHHNAGMPDYLGSGQSGIMKKMPMPGSSQVPEYGDLVQYRNAPVYQTEMPDV